MGHARQYGQRGWIVHAPLGRYRPQGARGETGMTRTAGELGRAIGAGKVHPVELVEEQLATIEAHPLAERIYARLTPQRARAEAMAAAGRAKAGLRRGPLDGVPVSWKDLFDTAGVATEAGSALLRGRVPERDAEVLWGTYRGGSGAEPYQVAVHLPTPQYRCTCPSSKGVG